MAFISSDTIKNMRRRRAKELDLEPYVGEPKKLLVRPIPFFDALALHGSADLPPKERMERVVKALASSALNPETLEPITEEELRSLVAELDQGEAQSLITQLQNLSAKKSKEEEAAAGK